MFDRKSLEAIATSYATASAGMHPSHTLPVKLKAIAEAGFKWTEIAFSDLEKYASSKHENYRKIDGAGSGDVDKLLGAAEEIHELCRRLGLHVLTMMPFSEFEGYEDKATVERGLQRARTWFKMLKVLECQMLQVGSSDDPSISSDFGVIARNLQALADEAGAQDPPVRIAYEMWAWGTHVNTWEHTWEICKRVDRPNFGLCLDTFQISAIHRVAEVSLPSALGDTVPPPQTALADSLQNLTSTLAPHTSKIFYLQISDGARADPAALSAKAGAQGIHVLYAWSNEHRPLPFQDGCGGFLPVLDVVSAILATGWRGPWSYEVFFAEDQGKDDPDVPRRWTTAAMASHEKIIALLEGGGRL
ncbi:xylose isomerase-like protein [Phellopilus nigrolimitatus]|nr:xylose isomerase-like protein [Phellopilus nigrolimitatus]